MAALNALGMVLQFGAAQIRPGQIDRVQKIINVRSVFHMELVPQPLHRQLQAPAHVPIFLQEFPGVVIPGVLCNILLFPLTCHADLPFLGHRTLPMCMICVRA